MRLRFSTVCLCSLAWSTTAVAQGAPLDLPDNLTSAESIASAAQTLSEAGTDKVLIRDLLGKTLTGKDGESVGTIEDFAVIPGGRLVAAMVSTSDGSLLAVPYAAIKLANAAGKVSLSVPVSASELQGMSELRSLGEASSK